MLQHRSKLSEATPKWDVASLIDLEYLNEAKSNLDIDIKARDRAFYLALSKSGGLDPAAITNKSIVFRRWVDERRQSPEFPKPGPGETTAGILALARFWGGLGCVLLGALFAWGALNISGRQVNVIQFWCLIVGLPFFFTLLGFYLLLGDRCSRFPRPPGIFRIWLGRWIIDAGNRTTRLFHRKSSQEHALRISRLSGEIKRRIHGRGELLTVAFGSLFYFLGLGLVTGIFLAIVLFRFSSYQDYGWQTHSGWLTETKVHSLVGVVSAPWACFAGDGDGYPTASQIHETRIFRNDATMRENPAASVTWSSFLLWSSFVYGLLPRLALCVLGQIHLRRAYAREDFHRFDALWRRLTMPDVRIDTPAEDPLPPTMAPRVLHQPAEFIQGSDLLLAPIEFNVPEVSEKLQTALRSHDLRFDSVITLPSLPSARQSLLASLADPATGSPARLLILQESVMPANQSFVGFLRKIRQTFGVRLPIHVLLLHDVAAPNADQYLAAWRSRLDPLGDALLSLITIRIEPNIHTSSP